MLTINVANKIRTVDKADPLRIYLIESGKLLNLKIKKKAERKKQIKPIDTKKIFFQLLIIRFPLSSLVFHLFKGFLIIS